MVGKLLSALAAGLAAGTAAALLFSTAPAVRADDSLIWTVGPTFGLPEPGALSDVSVLSNDDVWGVGMHSDPALPLVAHWTGRDWTPVRTPEEYQPVAVDAGPTGTVWVVGQLKPDAGGGVMPLLARYGGGAWLSVPVTVPVGASATLTDIEVLDTGDGWAVGSVTAKGASQAMVLRLTAGQWRQISLRPLGMETTLSSVYAAGPNDVWAVGTLRDASGSSNLVLHWNGDSWEREPLPTVRSGSRQELNAVSGGGGQVWAVGQTCVDGPAAPICQAVALRRDGQGWQAIPVAAQSSHDLVEVVVVSATDIWVFGYVMRDAVSEREHVEHWDGTGFGVVNVRSTPPGNDFPAAGLVAAHGVPGTQSLWAVGWLDERTTGRANVMVYR